LYLLATKTGTCFNTKELLPPTQDSMPDKHCIQNNWTQTLHPWDIWWSVCLGQTLLSSLLACVL